MRKFLYLVQGQSDLVNNFLHLTKRSNASAIFLTFDKPIKEAEYLPNSTWAQGRNKMLEIASTKKDYLYYIFCDDDITFKKGGWDEFEKYLTTIRPAIAIPVFLEKIKKTPLLWLRYNSFLFNDEQMIAFHRDVVKDCIVLPYQSRFDDIHWWASCRIQQILIQNFYSSNSIQLNNIHISNEFRLRYPNSYTRMIKFKKYVRDWCDNQFKRNYKDIDMSIRKNILTILWSTFKFAIHSNHSRRNLNYSINENEMRNILFDNSELHKQYLEGLITYSNRKIQRY